MKKVLASVAAVLALSSMGVHAQSTASSQASIASGLVIVALPVAGASLLAHGASQASLALGKGFDASITSISERNERNEQKIEAQTKEGANIEMTFPAKEVEKLGIKPGQALKGTPMAAGGLVITVDGKHVALAMDQAAPGLSKSKAL